jgi:catechol-2,3-dioxygenase
MIRQLAILPAENDEITRRELPERANPIQPLGVGEIVLRVADINRSISFYRDVLGFPLIRVLHDSIAFMRVADGVAGHTQIIGLTQIGRWSRLSRTHARYGDMLSACL